ncbi:hypothetical protein [Oceanobacter mangrovi]|uniref:hypothetical protein n=1 Tax=Oceanobacter mangrovi TaxID=2862510 RepID=UPI001C8CFE40|nr:hypothetical protein [Oceanobacter mangrovi]
MCDNKQELKQKIEALEASLTELKQRLAALESGEQHDAVEHLDEHIRVIDHEYDSLKEFWPVFVEDFRKLFQK